MRATTLSSVPKSPNGNRPSPLDEKVRDVGLASRVISWVDVALDHLISDHRRRTIIQRSREIDDWIERVAHRLTRRQRRRGRG